MSKFKTTMSISELRDRNKASQAAAQQKPQTPPPPPEEKG